MDPPDKDSLTEAKNIEESPDGDKRTLQAAAVSTVKKVETEVTYEEWEISYSDCQLPVHGRTDRKQKPDVIVHSQNEAEIMDETSFSPNQLSSNHPRTRQSARRESLRPRARDMTPGAFRVGFGAVAHRVRRRKLNLDPPSLTEGIAYSITSTHLVPEVTAVDDSHVRFNDNSVEEQCVENALATPLDAVRVVDRPVATEIKLGTSEPKPDENSGSSPRPYFWIGCVALFVTAASVLFLFLITASPNSTPSRVNGTNQTALPTWSAAPITSPTMTPTLRKTVRRVIVDRDGLLEAIREFMLATNDGTAEELAPIEFWNVSAVTDMSQAFSKYRYSIIGGLFNHDISRWDVSSVVNMDDMFAGAHEFDQDLSTWQTSRVTSLARTFYNAHKFNGDISTWNTSRIVSLTATFRGAKKFNADLSNWSVSSVTTLESTFFGANSFSSDISKWDVSLVRTLRATFSFAYEFDPDIGDWNVANVEEMIATFEYTPFNHDIGRWNTSKVTTMKRVFFSTEAFNRDISQWDIARVQSMEEMFYRARRFNHSLSWHTVSLLDVRSMFRQADLFNSPITLNVSNVVALDGVFRDAKAFNQDISHWDVSRVQFMVEMFRGTPKFHQNLRSWDVQNLRVAKHMFDSATAFNGDVTTWQTNRLEDASEMFAGAVSFDRDISRWNVSRLVNASAILRGAHRFNHSLCNWSTQLGSQVLLEDMLSSTSCPVQDSPLPEIALCHMC